MNVKQAIAEFDSEIQQAEAELAALRVRLETLRKMRSKLTTEANQPSAARESNGRLGPSKAVKRHLSNSPGQDIEAVIEALDGHIRSKANNQARVLRNTIANLLRDGILRKDDNGGLFVNEGGPTASSASPLAVRAG